MLTVETNTRPEPKAMDPLAHWPEALRSECEKNQFSGIVGTVLVSETPTMRIWHLRVPAGGRCPFHRHVNDYFWTAHTAGKARTYYHDGRIVEDRHYVGETKHFRFGPGEFFVHSVENVGDTDLLFTTVEFLNGANEPLPVPDSVRLKAPPEQAA
jgi:beta-alanine degradation protein BauB